MANPVLVQAAAEWTTLGGIMAGARLATDNRSAPFPRKVRDAVLDMLAWPYVLWLMLRRL